MKLSSSHLNHATAFFVVDYSQFGHNWIFGLKLELMACSGLVVETRELSCLIPEII